MLDPLRSKRLYGGVETLCADYRDTNLDAPKLTSHLFRKRACMLAWKKGIDVRHVGIARGRNVNTMLKHYVLMNEQAVMDGVFATTRNDG